MKHFRTDVRVSKSEHEISLKTPVFTVGSCFADAIGGRLHQHKFSTLINPFGVIYNPISIHKLLLKSVKLECADEHTYLENNELHLNYDFHSEVSALSKNELSAKIQERIKASHELLKNASWLMITYGTSWVYERRDNGEIVANCHKLPSKFFEKKLLNEDSIIRSFNLFYEDCKKFNPGLKIILTVSPVRHLKDTLELNSVSKAILRTVCHNLSYAFDNVEYFPAYEMMLDDLRDYRFYKSDMLHPSADAEDYIWEKFTERYFSNETTTFVKKWDEILAAMKHKPFHPASASHQKFLSETLNKLEALNTIVDTAQEMTLIKSQLI